MISYIFELNIFLIVIIGLIGIITILLTSKLNTNNLKGEKMIAKKNVESTLFKKVIGYFKKQKAEKNFVEFGKYSMIFRYGIIKIGKDFQEDVEFNSFTPNINISRIESLVFDVNGLDKNYMTQIEIVKEDGHYTLYTMPNRDKNVIDDFVKEIKSFK